MFLSIIALLVLTIIGYTSLQFSNEAMTDIISNWQMSPFTDLIATAGGGCPAQYEQFLNDEWEGTVSGCNCVGRYSYRIPVNERNRLFRGFCSLNMTYAGCQNVQSINPVKYTVWRGNTLCVKRAGETYQDYMANSVENKPGNTCKSGYKLCGVLDTMGNLLCIEENKDCPVNKIIVQSSSQAAPTDFLYTKISLSNGVNIYFTNNATDSQIVKDIKISEGQVCIDPAYINTMYPNQYILDRDYGNFGCTTQLKTLKYDTRYTQFDSESKATLFNDNYITPMLYRLPYYPFDTLQASEGLYTRPFIGWRLICNEEQFYNTGLVSNMQQRIDTLITFKLVMMIFAILLTVYFIAQIILKCCVGKDNAICFNLIEIPHLIFVLIILIFAFICISDGQGYSMKLYSFNCGDNITNQIFQNMGKELAQNVTFDKATGGLGIFCFSAYLLYLLGEILYNCLKDIDCNKIMKSNKSDSKNVKSQNNIDLSNVKSNEPNPQVIVKEDKDPYKNADFINYNKPNKADFPDFNEINNQI